MALPVQHKITATRNYRLFGLSGENRPVNLKKHKKLVNAMRHYGYLWCFPIVCVRDSKGGLIVKDGQHRLSIAEELGLPVHYVVTDTDFDVAIINSTPQGWTLYDYAQKFAADGVRAYQEGLDFAAQYKLPIGITFTLLGGATTFGNVHPSFIEGTFTVKEAGWAHMVASIYTTMVRLAPPIRNARFIEACMAICRVHGFDPDRLLHAANRYRDKLIACSTRDACLDMMEDLYNYRQKKLVALKLSAIAVMRSRQAAERSARKKATQPQTEFPCLSKNSTSTH